MTTQTLTCGCGSCQPCCASVGFCLGVSGSSFDGSYWLAGIEEEDGKFCGSCKSSGWDIDSSGQLVAFSVAQNGKTVSLEVFLPGSGGFYQFDDVLLSAICTHGTYTVASGPLSGVVFTFGSFGGTGCPPGTPAQPCCTCVPPQTQYFATFSGDFAGLGSVPVTFQTGGTYAGNWAADSGVDLCGGLPNDTPHITKIFFSCSRVFAIPHYVITVAFYAPDDTSPGHTEQFYSVLSSAVPTPFPCSSLVVPFPSLGSAQTGAPYCVGLVGGATVTS